MYKRPLYADKFYKYVLLSLLKCSVIYEPTEYLNGIWYYILRKKSCLRIYRNCHFFVISYASFYFDEDVPFDVYSFPGNAPTAFENAFTYIYKDYMYVTTP